MTYRATGINIQEIEITRCGYAVGTMIDTEVTMVLDKYGELVEVELEGKREFGRQRMVFFIDHNSRGIEAQIWSAAKAHFDEHKWAILDRADIPFTGRHEFADERLPQSAFI